MKTVTSHVKSLKLVKALSLLATVTVLFFSGAVFAESTGGIGDIASSITGSFKALGQLILAISFLAGIGFVMAAIFKFKQHKDNPTQVTLGQPVAMLVIGIVLMFLPNLIKPAGTTIFGTSATTGGFKGNISSGLIPGVS